MSDNEEKNDSVDGVKATRDSENRALLNEMNEDKQMKILLEEKQRLKKLLAAKEERVRKLKLVKIYDSKHNLEKLDSLVLKWRTASQEAAEELYTMFSEPKPPVGEFLTQMQVDHQLIHFDTESESFH